MSGATPVGYYEWLNFNSPMTEATADGLVAELALTEPSHILDVGCGWAELLLRLLVACPNATGYGIDNDDALIERAERNAANRNLASRVTFSATLADAVTADLVLSIGAEHVFGTLDQALIGLFKLVRPGGQMLLGTQFWEQAPAAGLVEAIGELPTLGDLIDTAIVVGLRPLGVKVASLEDWDHFEFRFMADWERFIMSSTTHGEADEARRASDLHRAAYLQRRGILGFVFLALGRPVEPDVASQN
jgi:precorrin-6B methylase 2